MLQNSGLQIKWIQFLMPFIPLGIFIIGWQMYSGGSPQREFYFSSPLAVIKVLLEDISNGSLLRHTAITSFEALAGFILGNLFGALLGISLAQSAALAKISKPYLAALGSVPVFALGPLTIIWFGVGITAKIVLAFLATVFVAASNAYKGVEQIDPLYIKRVKIYKASKRKVFQSITLPASSVWVISSLRLTIGLALLGAFIGEFIASNEGLGYMIVRAGGLYDTARVFSGILVIMLLALSLDYLVGTLEQKLLKWQIETN